MIDPVKPEPIKPETKEDTLWLACGKHAQDQEVCYKIMTGVFVADSSWCTKGQGKSNRNCGNIRPGSGKYGDPEIEWVSVNNFRRYATIEEGIYDNVALYAQLYEGKSIEYMRNVWAGGSLDWKRTVLKYYNQ